MRNVEWVEVLPFHQMGAFKWKSLGLDYKLDNTPTPTEAQVSGGAGDLPRRRLPRALKTGRVTMMASISELIGTQPILALFLAIGLGYAVGQINILGFSLGVGAVLFVGLFSAPSRPRHRSPARSGWSG